MASRNTSAAAAAASRRPRRTAARSSLPPTEWNDARAFASEGALAWRLPDQAARRCPAPMRTCWSLMIRWTISLTLILFAPVIRSGADCRMRGPPRRGGQMQRYLPVILLTCVMLSSPFGGAIAQSKPTVVVKDVTQQNPLIDDVARDDPDGLPSASLLQRLDDPTGAVTGAAGQRTRRDQCSTDRSRPLVRASPCCTDLCCGTADAQAEAICQG